MVIIEIATFGIPPALVASIAATRSLTAWLVKPHANVCNPQGSQACRITGLGPKLGAKVVDRLERWVVMEAPTGQRFCVVRVQRPGFPKNATRWG